MFTQAGSNWSLMCYKQFIPKQHVFLSLSVRNLHLPFRLSKKHPFSYDITAEGQEFRGSYQRIINHDRSLAASQELLFFCNFIVEKYLAPMKLRQCQVAKMMISI